MISMHAGQPGTRRRQMARPVGAKSHSTVVAYEGESNEVTAAIRRAERPVSSNSLLAKPRVQFGMQPGGRTPCHAKRREIAPSEAVEEKSATMSIAGEDVPLVLARRANIKPASEQGWTQRGIFKLGFNSGSPRVRSARKFTK